MDFTLPPLARPQKKLRYVPSQECVPTRLQDQPVSLRDLDHMFDDMDSLTGEEENLPPLSPVLTIYPAVGGGEMGCHSKTLPGESLPLPARASTPDTTLKQQTQTQSIQDGKDESGAQGDLLALSPVLIASPAADGPARASTPDTTLKQQTQTQSIQDGKDESGAQGDLLALSPVLIASPAANGADDSEIDSPPVKFALPGKCKTPDDNRKSETLRQVRTLPPVTAPKQQTQTCPPVTAPKQQTQTCPPPEPRPSQSTRGGKDMSDFLLKLRESMLPKPSCSWKSSPVKEPALPPEPELDEFLILEDDSPRWFTIPKKPNQSKARAKQGKAQNSSSNEDVSTDTAPQGDQPETAAGRPKPGGGAGSVPTEAPHTAEQTVKGKAVLGGTSSHITVPSTSAGRKRPAKERGKKNSSSRRETGPEAQADGSAGQDDCPVDDVTAPDEQPSEWKKLTATSSPADENEDDEPGDGAAEKSGKAKAGAKRGKREGKSLRGKESKAVRHGEDKPKKGRGKSAKGRREEPEAAESPGPASGTEEPGKEEDAPGVLCPSEEKPDGGQEERDRRQTEVSAKQPSDLRPEKAARRARQAQKRKGRQEKPVQTEEEGEVNTVEQGHGESRQHTFTPGKKVFDRVYSRTPNRNVPSTLNPFTPQGPNDHVPEKRQQKTPGNWWELNSCPVNGKTTTPPPTEPGSQKGKRGKTKGTQPKPLKPLQNGNTVRTAKPRRGSLEPKLRKGRQGKPVQTEEEVGVNTDEQDQGELRPQLSPIRQLIFTPGEKRKLPSSLSPIAPQRPDDHVPEKRQRKPPGNWWEVNESPVTAETTTPPPQKPSPRKGKGDKTKGKPPKPHKSLPLGPLQNGNTIRTPKPRGGSLEPKKKKDLSATRAFQKRGRKPHGTPQEQGSAQRSLTGEGPHAEDEELGQEPAEGRMPFDESGNAVERSATSQMNWPANNNRLSDNTLKGFQSGPSSMIDLEQFEQNEDLSLPSTRVLRPTLCVSDLCGPPLRPLLVQDEDHALLVDWLRVLWPTNIKNGGQVTPEHFQWYSHRGRAIGFNVDVQTDSICNGKMLLGSFMKKPLWVDHNTTSVYTVLTSCVSVTINGKESHYNPGQAFMIPCGHAYSIHNPAQEPAVLCFTRVLAESPE